MKPGFFTLLFLIGMTFCPAPANQTVPPRNYGPPYFYPANPADRLYKLPYEAGKSFLTNGGYASDPNPMGGYLHPDYSVDFDLPEGEPVLCARSGRVYSFTTVDTGCNSGTDGGNVLWISHLDSLPDATKPSGWKYTTTKDKYLHIQPRIPVKAGDNVVQGQVIAYCSCTGTGYPHVHFRVGVTGHAGWWDADPSYTFESVPTPFVEILNRPNGLPEKGDYYVSQNVKVTAVETPAPSAAADRTLIRINPNPFNIKTTIRLLNAGSEAVNAVRIFNLKGEMINEFSSAPLRSGEFIWDAGKLPGGVYLVRAAVGKEIHTEKLMLVK